MLHEAITGYLNDFFFNQNPSNWRISMVWVLMELILCHGTGVQKCLRFLPSSALYIHCPCHQLQLAAISAANDHTEGQRVLGTVLTI